MTLRVLLVDDHPVFRAGMRAVLDDIEDIEVVGEAEDAERALEFVSTVRPSIVVMDLHLPGRSGIEAIRELAQQHPQVHVLVMTISAEDEAVVAAMRAGARGYLVKGAGCDEVLQAIRTVGAGGAVFSPLVAERLTAFFVGVAAVPSREIFPTLTNREREVLDLMARGYDNRRIAREVVLSEKTVRNNVSNLFTKLQVNDRAAAIVRARNAGLGQ